MWKMLHWSFNLLVNQDIINLNVLQIYEKKL